LLTVLICHAVAVLIQAALAGQFLSGSDQEVAFHELTGWLILSICLVQIVLAAVFLSSGVSSIWILFGSIFIFLGEGLQIGTGYARFLKVHVPLGVIVFAAVIWQLIVVAMSKAPSGGASE
jgi:hypothetical protein